MNAEKEEKDLKDGILVEVTQKTYIGKKISECSVNELIQMEREKKIKSVFTWRILRNKGELALCLYAEKKGYNPYWVRHQLKNQDKKYSDYTIER